MLFTIICKINVQLFVLLYFVEPQTGFCGTSWGPYRATDMKPLTGFMENVGIFLQTRNP